MNLFFLRHGQAAAHAIDRERPLTDCGIEQVRACAQLAAVELSALQQIFVSPYLRAQQTCAHFIAEAALQVPVATVDWLTPASSAAEVVKQLLLQQGDVLLISHQPLAGDLMRYLNDTPQPLGFIDTANLIGLRGATVARQAMTPYLRIDSSGRALL